MDDFKNKYKKLFLDKEDGNFSDLIKSINYIENKIKEAYSIENPSFYNDSMEVQFSGEIPEYGKTSELVLTEVIPAFKNLIRWNHPNTLHNITSPSLLDGVAAKTITSLYNPNCIWDYVSGHFISLEQAVSDQIASLVGFNKGYAGNFTFGGKGTLLYAIRLGINRCDRESVMNGVDKDTVVITSISNHYSIEYICSLAGLGKKACIRIPVDSNGLVDLTLFELKVDELLKQNKKIACVILSGGNSLNNTIDPFKEINLILERLVERYKLSYKPFIHADSVIGWLWLMYKNYDFLKNPLEIKSAVLKRIMIASERISEISIADSLGIDFHKNAFASYTSSLFLCKNGNELYSLNSVQELSAVQNKYGNNFLQHHTLEHSRSGDGIISAYISLQELGIDGFQRYIAKMMTLNEYIRQNIDPQQFEIVNPQGLGFPVVVFPRPLFINELYSQFTDKSEVDIKRIQDYCYGLFNYISTMRDKNVPVIGYVSNYSKTAEGYDVPAFKLYPMSPNTTEKSIQIILNALVNIKSDFDKNWSHSEHDALFSKNVMFPK